MNYLHDVNPGNKEKINTIIEIPKGSHNKYEIDKETGLIALDRVYSTSQHIPFDYGFVPQTLWDDGDALDVVVLTTFPLAVGIVARVRPVAMMDMIDSGESDVKIIAVPADDPRWSEVQDLKDINKHTLKEIAHYFSTYKNLQNKVVEVKEFYGKDKAIEAFEKSLLMYTQKKNS